MRNDLKMKIAVPMIKRLVWKYTKNYYEKRAEMELVIDQENNEIRYDGKVYTAMHYGFNTSSYLSQSEIKEFNIDISKLNTPPKISHLIDDLIKNFPSFHFELANYGIISYYKK